MTALEFLNEYQQGKIILESHLEEGHAFYSSAQGAMYITDVMTEFAQMHVEKALKEASEKVILDIWEEYVDKKEDKPIDGDIYTAYVGYNDDLELVSVNKNSILNAYPLENIKSY